jgi:hypothetical protein|tara:strand:- start:4058 stop:5461 length:1404 start_codon:yes stop_codon:yes gene_type:complete
MSVSGLDYMVTTTFGNNDRLLIHYDFTDGTGTPLIAMEEESDDADIYLNAVLNQEPATNTGVLSGIISDAANTLFEGAAASRRFATGTFLVNNNADFRKSNLKINTPSLDYSSVSAIFDFQFTGIVNDAVLFGSLEKTSTTFNDEVTTGAKGFNFGVNDRGKLFYQGFDTRGDFIYTANSIELSQRNIIGFSVSSNTAEITKLDYLNKQRDTERFPIDTSFMADNEEFYLGGSENYFRGHSGEFKTFSGALNRFALFSGYIPPSLMMKMGSGLIGDYFLNAAATTPKSFVTGYSQDITFKTGITGYTYEVTGTLEIATGRDMQTGSITAGTPHDTGEGDRYFKYYTLNNGEVDSFYKEELGFLHPNSGYVYLPTGDGAFATLGLRPVEGEITPYSVTEGLKTGGSVIINLYDSIALTGVLPQISGVAQTPVTQTATAITTPANSGVILLGNAELLKKDFLFFLEERI